MFETHGWGEITSELHALLERGDTEAMTSLITDEILGTFSVSATWDGLAGALAARYGGLVDRVAPYGSETGADAVDQEQWDSVGSPGPYRDAYLLTVDTYVLDFH